MKIDRRSFLSLSVGATAGVTLSPLPWKLTDDLSIWTQNWPWTPVPADGEVTYEDSVCGLCPGGCGVTARKVGDRVVKIEGRKGYPVNDGGVCLLGLSGPQLLYGPTRVKTPLKRVGERGEGKWKKISWEEAISETASLLGDLRDAGKSWAVGCVSGSGHGVTARLFERFMTAYGSSNFMTAPSMDDSFALAMGAAPGEAAAAFDFENADFVLSFGSAVLDGWGSPARMFMAHGKWVESGGKLVQVEPRFSNTAAKAYKWLPARPGTETALALGIAHVIIRSGGYDREFISRATSGFDAFKKFVKDYSPEKVAEITGIGDPDLIRVVAREFAAARRPVAICGRGQGDAAGSLGEFSAVHSLNALVGSVNRDGGVWALEKDAYIRWPEPEKDEAARAGLGKGRADGAGVGRYAAARSLLNRFPARTLSGEYPLEALLIHGANPLYSMPDTATVKKAFDRAGTIISFSSYMDETAMYADLILPNHVYLERYEDVPVPPGMPKPVTGLAKPVVEPLFDTMHSGDAVIRLAGEMGGSVAASFKWESHEACLRETLGNKWDALLNDGFWSDPGFSPKKRKFAFYSKDMGTVSPGAGKENGAYPLVLVPYDSIRLAHNYIGAPPFAVKTVEDTVLKGKDALVQINPKTAKKIGLANGAPATISTPVGSARVRVNVSEGIMPGVAAMPKGLGHTAFDKYLADKGLNVNELMAPMEDPASGFDAAWGVMAKLIKA
ncbi:conserved hypothetical protein [Candidatus Desulfarcum epimagneticum]|uniref:4Fe-4S Mo/W bis-MGD-type domain-containing protein n=1 Tax=uncultured Desulfobacteraceae bacterium TaxID=218296 RepID=A0A484HCR4_9BACT|nr:conserved hypothetical protein [uncultured Desulfobacteraceae bacterium]